uniref:Putative secreted protein n=1 Tax=Anopheles darlingi TaxID=43151 RepID=A0A2M4DKU0_ANODA
MSFWIRFIGGFLVCVSMSKHTHACSHIYLRPFLHKSIVDKRTLATATTTRHNASRAGGSKVTADDIQTHTHTLVSQFGSNDAILGRVMAKGNAVLPGPEIAVHFGGQPFAVSRSLSFFFSLSLSRTRTGSSSSASEFCSPRLAWSGLAWSGDNYCCCCCCCCDVSAMDQTRTRTRRAPGPEV